MAVIASCRLCRDRCHNSGRIQLFIFAVYTFILVSVSPTKGATLSTGSANHGRDNHKNNSGASSILHGEPTSINNDDIDAAAPPKKENSQQRSRNQRRRMSVAPLNVFLLMKDQFDKRRGSIEDLVFQSLNAFSTTSGNDYENNDDDDKGTSPSRLYTYDAFFRSLRSLAVGGILGDSFHWDTNPYSDVPGILGDASHMDDESNEAFYVSQDDPSNANAMKYAIVNVCAFLANAMAEAIQFDACEEFNGMVSGALGSPGGDVDGRGLLNELGGVNGRYFPMANACGQLGQLYQEQESDDSDACPPDPNLEVTAVLHPKYNYNPAKDYGGKRHRPPPPFRCVPRDFPEDYAGYWDGYDLEFVRRVAYPSALGQLSVQGCCWWGRGALMTRGAGGLGRINKRLGKAAYDAGRPSRYPGVDFCRTPSAICGEGGRADRPELKYVVALFDWVDRVQSYSNAESKWEYLLQLKYFVDEGMEDGGQFVDAVSSILARGCDGYYCSEQTIHFMDERRRNFETLIYDVFNLQGLPDELPRSVPPPVYDFDHAMRWLHSKRSKIEGNVFVSRNDALGGLPYFSREFRFEPFLSALRTTSHFGVGFKYFFVSDVNQGLPGFNAGLVNLAFFLANAVSESITHDSCDEVHWEKNDGRYAIANSCGQNGRSYGDETCPRWQGFITCNVDTEAEIEARTPLTTVPPFMLDARALPPPLQCRAGTDPAGYWDEATQTLQENATYFNSGGRSDVEGCCFWGRGALLTRGTCNYGKLNYYLGAQAAAQSRPAIYPDINFCSNPDAICNGDNMETRYVVGMFEWIDRVQDYYDSNVDWSYQRELYKFVDNGMDDDVFIDSVSNIFARGCHQSHQYNCSSITSQFSVNSNRLLYGLERKINFKNILKLVFELPIVAQPVPEDGDESEASSAETQIIARRPTYRPTLKPTIQPSMTVPDPSLPPAVSPGTSPPTPRRPQEPTGTPVEWSDITSYNDGEIHLINNTQTSFIDESIAVSKNTTLILDRGGYIEAPLNTDWPAVRISISSRFVGQGGFVNGSYADTSLLEGECVDGGEAIHVNNGQSGTETASYAEFYDGIHVIGGDAPDGVGGNALHVNGFGTTADIHGGSFLGGKGADGDDGLSLYVLNSATVHIRGGTFRGDMKVERYGQVRFYGCFVKDDKRVTGVFPDESELDVTVMTYYGGEVVLIPVSEQECETAPSTSPTEFPTLSPQPSVTRPNHGDNTNISYELILVAFAFIGMHKMF